MRSLECYFGVYFPHCCATREINIKITLSWAHKQFARRVDTLFYITTTSPRGQWVKFPVWFIWSSSDTLFDLTSCCFLSDGVYIPSIFKLVHQLFWCHIIGWLHSPPKDFIVFYIYIYIYICGITWYWFWPICTSYILVYHILPLKAPNLIQAPPWMNFKISVTLIEAPSHFPNRINHAVKADSFSCCCRSQYSSLMSQ